ncbi:MAG TPA: ABC transporter substrate-binding protein [Acetobacteraceae bacterium]|jgi:peptide/nickel transport system substrate-binding protein|nr:ABC transporter substrate-binding protein [Acetobacteraceae bacterium]
MRDTRLMAAAVLAGCLFASAAAWAQTTQTQASAFDQSGLVGKLEAPTIVTDPAQTPKTFHDAPMLADQVKAGTLPPVAQRLPDEPMVIKPLHNIGKYGGTWRRGFIGPSDSENGNRIRSGEKLIYFDATGTELRPNAAKSWEVSEDGRRTTIHLRRGMKWSDGAPFNADDFVFWFQDMYQNKDLVPAPAPEMAANGKPGRVVKVDDTTVAVEFDDPNFLFLRLLAGDTLIGGGPSRTQAEGNGYGLFAPAHYLKQFLPKNTPLETLNAQAKAAGYDNWVQYFHFKSDWRLNRDLPTIAAWKMVQPITGQQWVLERNPYYYQVDTAGNQLPYIDRIQLTLAENPEVINLRAIAGEYDEQERHTDLGKLPTFIDNAARSHYKIHLDLAFNGADTAIMFDLAYRDDPEIAKWITNADFRRALALGIDRDQMNQAFWLGLGTPGSVAPSELMLENPGKEWRTAWSVLDVAKANAMLDKIGLAKKDSEGFRLRTDNGQRLRLQVDVAQALNATWPQQTEMVTQQWKAIGIAADVKVFERSLFFTRMRTDKDQMIVWTNNGTESLFLYPVWALPADPTSGGFGAAYGLWYVSNGTAGTKPTSPELLRVYELMHGAAGQQEAERNKTAQEIWRIAIDQQWAIGTVGLSPAFFGVRIVSDKLENMPERVCISQHCRTPWSAHPEQWYYR